MNNFRDIDSKLGEIKNLRDFPRNRKTIFDEIINNNEEAKENQKILINFYYNVFIDNQLCDMSGGDNNRLKLYLNKEVDLEDNKKEEIQKIFNKYVKIYGNLEKDENDAYTDSIIMDKEIEQRWGFGEEKLGYIEGNINVNHFKMLNKRKEGFNKCIKTDNKSCDSINSFCENPEEYYPKNDSDKELQSSCQSLKWGPKYFDNDKCNISSFKEDELLLGTIKDGLTDASNIELDERQYVFGYGKSLEKYRNCNKFFNVMNMAMISEGEKTCNPYITWTQALNTLYTLCSNYSKSKFIRFVLNEGRVTPHHRYRIDENEKIFKMIPVGIITFDFENDKRLQKHRSCDKEGKNCKYSYILFYNKNKKIDYYNYDTINAEYSDFFIYNIFGMSSYIGLLFGPNTVTYMEFNTFICYLSKNNKIYRSIKYPNILFIPTYKSYYDKEKLSQLGLEKIKYNCDRLLIKGYIDWTKKYITLEEYNEKNIQKYKDNNINIYKTTKKKYYIVSEKMLPDTLKKKYNILNEKRRKNKKITSRSDSLDWRKPEQKGEKIPSRSDSLDWRKRDKVQTGGVKRLPYKLKFIDEFKHYDINIATKYFKEFKELSFYYWGIFDDKKYDIFSLNLNNYEFVIPQDFSYVKNPKIKKHLNKKIKIEKLLDETKPHTSIIKYKPLTNKFFHFYEIINNYLLLEKNKKANILEVTNHPSFIESCNYYIKKNNLNSPIYDLSFFMKYSVFRYLTNKDKLEMLDFTTQQLNINKQIINEYFNRSIIENNIKKYDLICCNILYASKELRQLLIPNYNTQLYFNQYIYSLFRLDKKGHLVNTIFQVITKPIADLIILVSEFFEDTIIHNYEVHNKYKWSSVSIIHKNFKGIKDEDKNKLLKIFDELYKYDPTGISNFNITDKKIRKDYAITKEIKPNFKYKYIDSFLDIESSNKIYDDIRRKNTQIYIEKNIHMEKLIELKQMDKQEQNKRIEKYRKVNIMNSILYAKKYGFDYIELDEKNIDQQIARIIIQDMFSYHHSITFKFKYYQEKWKMIKIPEIFNELKVKMNMINLLISTRNMQEWENTKNIIRYYKPKNKILHLTTSVNKNFETGEISQEWLKIYDIINKFDLLSTKMKIIKTFHISKPRLNDVKAINHYIKTKTSSQLKWNAYTNGTSDMTEKYSDVVFINKRTPNKMLDSENIKLYKKYTEDSELITSNIHMSGLNEQDKLKEQYKQTLFILNNLPIGSNFIAKYSLPQNYPIQISTIYILYKSFDELIFYKDSINPYSNKFHIIGKGYKGVSKNILDNMFKVLNNFNKNTHIEIELYPMNFLYQLEKILNKLINYYSFNIDRQMYYINYYENISDKYKELINKQIKEKNKDFIEKLNLEKINSIDNYIY